MIVIKKITVKYSREEDRLCLATETVDGNTLVLWLTARLAVRLVDHLLNKVDQVKQPTPVATKPESRVKQQAMQQWEQSAANMVMKPSPEVKVQPEASEKLISSVDIGLRDERYVLVFRWAKKDGAQMAFSTIEMRQFQQILHTNFKAAGWPMTVWPTGYDQQKSLKKETIPMVLH